jgi:hypothetical protein
MSIGSLRVQPRRGAWGIGSRRATAAAAACLAMLGFVLAVSPEAAASPCGDGPAQVSPDQCAGPESVRRDGEPRREKSSDIRSLAVFVLAVAGALLIPIGRGGAAHGRAPGGDQARNSEIR